MQSQNKLKGSNITNTSNNKISQTRFHFIGIGGIGMCGLAELMHNSGAVVTGSDLNENANTNRLKELGMTIFNKHASENVNEADVVVYSSAIPFTNLEIKEAKARSIPLIPRAEALAEIMRIRRGIAVAGTHGKTTTTSMIASVFIEAQENPTIVVGGRFEKIKSTALLGTGEWLIAEADESDGSFNKLSPEIAIITNIDSDHMDHFKTFENLKKAFLDFAYKVPFYGAVIVCGDDLAVRQLFDGFNKRIIYYGFDSRNDFILKGEKGHYTLFHRIEETLTELGPIHIQVPGLHNALNAAAAIVAGYTAGLPFKKCSEGIEKFEGVDRRFQFKGELNQVKVYDDYGHHPTEVRATLQAFKEKFSHNRLVVYFQPHRFSRTQHCWIDFKSCFAQCDFLFLADIYAAGESALPGINSDQLLNEMRTEGKLNHQNSMYLSNEISRSDQIKLISGQLKAGDIFLTLGAGDGWKLGLNVIENFK